MKNSKEERASSIQDWEGYCSSREKSIFQSIDINDFRNFSYKILIDRIKEVINEGGNSCNKSVIEIGAGDSDLLIDICQRFNPLIVTLTTGYYEIY